MASGRFSAPVIGNNCWLFCIWCLGVFLTVLLVWLCMPQGKKSVPFQNHECVSRYKKRLFSDWFTLLSEIELTLLTLQHILSFVFPVILTHTLIYAVYPYVYFLSLLSQLKINDFVTGTLLSPGTFDYLEQLLAQGRVNKNVLINLQIHRGVFKHWTAAYANFLNNCIKINGIKSIYESLRQKNRLQTTCII